jgi:hypothetical protein
VADANEAFYRAFRAADLTLMRKAWAPAAPHAQCVHPGSVPVSGTEDVMASWEIIFAAIPPSTGLDIACTDVRVHAGDGWGFVTCIERTSSGSALSAVNVFERSPIDGSWAIVLHQAHGVFGIGG